MRWILILLLAACSSPAKEYPLPALAKQILHPLAASEGLFTTHCKRDEKGDCKWEMLHYDLSSAEVRHHLRDLKFICKVNGDIYRIAYDRPGLIRESYRQACFLFICGKREEVVLDYIPMTENQKLLDARTVCFSFAQYPIKETFDSKGKR